MFRVLIESEHYFFPPASMTPQLHFALVLSWFSLAGSRYPGICQFFEPLRISTLPYLLSHKLHRLSKESAQLVRTLIILITAIYIT